jgi:exosortase
MSGKGMNMKSADLADARSIKSRTIGFLVVCLFPFAVTPDLAKSLCALVLQNETFSQVPLIPLVSAFLIFSNRGSIFREVSAGRVLGISLTGLGFFAVGFTQLNPFEFSVPDQASAFACGVVLIWMGAFALFFGSNAFRAALFPILFLLFAVPLPVPIVSRATVLLQKGSAEVAEVFFRVASVPYLRQGFVFELPGVTIRVAEECSGIRSTLALLITAVLASHLFLKTAWRRLLLCVVVVPVAIAKNGLRIMGLSTLSIYVNPSFLTGPLHHQGGIVFFLIALVPMGFLLIWLQKTERSVAGA